MKTKKFLILHNADGVQVFEREFEISDAKFKEIVGINPFDAKAPYAYRINSTIKNKILALMGGLSDSGNSATIQWVEVPESESEKIEIIKKYIKNARSFVPSSDEEIVSWLKINCNAEWLFEKHMKEHKLLLAVEELHVITQCMYNQPLHDQNVSKNLTEARKLIAKLG